MIFLYNFFEIAYDWERESQDNVVHDKMQVWCLKVDS